MKEKRIKAVKIVGKLPKEKNIPQINREGAREDFDNLLRRAVKPNKK